MPRYDLVNDKTELALLYYRSGDFHKALATYSECIGILSNLPPETIKSIRVSRFGLSQNPIMGPLVHPQLGNILDQRSATYQKLSDSTKALEDARLLVKIEPISCKGYLRVGKLLISKNQHLKAYENFQTGIRLIESAQREFDIRVPERLFASMRRHHKELKSVLASRKLRELSSSGPSEKPSKGKAIVDRDSDANNGDPGRVIRNSSKHARIPAPSSFPAPRSVLLSRSLSEPYQAHKYNRALPSSTSELGVSVKSKPKFMAQPQSQKRYKRSSHDPFLYLSPELIELVFLLLSVKSVLLCRRVSKTWHDLLGRMPGLFSRQIAIKPGVTVPELLLGIGFIKRVIHHSFSKQVKSLKLRSCHNSAHLKAALELLISLPGLNLRGMDISDRHLSIQLLLGCFSKLGWRLNNFQRLEQLKLAIGTGSRNENFILELFKHLKVLCLVSVIPVMSSKYNELIPVSDKRYKELSLRSKSGIYESLEVLVYVNHPKLVGDGSGGKSAATFNPNPIFMSKQFPNLKELSLASCDFSSHLPRLGEFLVKTPGLRRLVLENNASFSMVELFHLLKNYNPRCRLEKLVFRDKVASSPQSLYEIGTTDLWQLNGLKQLDVAGSSLSPKGLLKLLQIANKDGNLGSLNIGQSAHLVFRADSFQLGVRLISLGEILRSAPCLSSLFLNDMQLDNRTMKQFHDDIEDFGYENLCLKTLDLSLCNRIEGYGLINLFKAYPTQTKDIGDGNSSPRFSIDTLMIDGLEIHQSTASLLQKYGYVRTIINDPLKQRWRVFGVNSLIVY